MFLKKRKALLAALLGAASIGISACDPNATYSGGVYYDGLLWNDYYNGYPRPPRPPRPPKPEHPIERPPRPEHPIARPPIARPPVARPPIHRPPVARPMPARR